MPSAFQLPNLFAIGLNPISYELLFSVTSDYRPVTIHQYLIFKMRHSFFFEAVLLSMNKFEGLLETIEILSDEKAMRSIRKSIKEARAGNWLDFDEVFAE